MEAFLPAFLAWARQPYRKQLIKDHIEIKAYCKRHKSVLCTTLKCKEREHKAYFFGFKLIYSSCMLWPTKGQKETGGETFKERKWHRRPWRQRWGRKWPACGLHRTSPQTAVQASASFQSPQPFHLLTDMMTFTLVFRKPRWGPVPLLCEKPGQSFPCTAAHTSWIQRSGSALLPWRCQPLVPGCCCRVFTAAFTLTPLPSSADLNPQQPCTQEPLETSTVFTTHLIPTPPTHTYPLFQRIVTCEQSPKIAENLTLRFTCNWRGAGSKQGIRSSSEKNLRALRPIADDSAVNEWFRPWSTHSLGLDRKGSCCLALTI